MFTKRQTDGQKETIYIAEFDILRAEFPSIERGTQILGGNRWRKEICSIYSTRQLQIAVGHADDQRNWLVFIIAV